VRYLKTNTATIVTVGPFFDKTDGVTLETALTITNEKISATVDLNNGSAPTLVLDNVTGATSGTDNDLNYITDCDAALMQLELTAANLNYVGRFFLTITDAANHVPVFHEFTILSAQAWDAMFGTGGLGPAPLDAAGVRSAVGLASANLDTQLAAILADTAAILTDTGATLDAKLDALAAALAIVDGIVDDILVDTGTTLDGKIVNVPDLVWDEDLSGHSTAGTAGKKLTDVAAGTDPWATALPGAYGAGTAGKILADVKTEVDSILVDTGTTLDDKIDALLVAPTAAEISDAVWDEANGGHLTAGTTGKRLYDAAAAGTPPTPGEIADAVWDEDMTLHTTIGTAGKILQAAQAAIISAAEVATAVWSKVVTGTVSAMTALATLYNGWTAGVGAGAGAGAVAFAVTVNVGGNPADGVEVWVTTDSAGTNVIAGTLVTDAFGHVTFMLDVGTYYLWKQKSEVNFTNPETIIVTAP
jgi:hypothetical protein